MILADTSVWIHHFRKTDHTLVDHLNLGSVACHPFIIGELACGNLRNRSEILILLQALPAAPVLEPDEIFYFIENNSLMGRGLGYVDMHLLASAILGHVVLWTTDGRLCDVATEFGISFLNT